MINVQSFYCKLKEQTAVSVNSKQIVLMMSVKQNHTLEMLQCPVSDHDSLATQIKVLVHSQFEILSVTTKVVRIT
jgi:hypothetical protein